MTTPDPDRVAEQVRWLVAAMAAVESNDDSRMAEAAEGGDPAVSAEFLAGVTLLCNKLIFDVAYFSGRTVGDVMTHLDEWSAGLPD